MNTDLTINLDLEISVEYKSYPAIPGQIHGDSPTPDEPATVEIQTVIAIYQPLTSSGGMEMMKHEQDITWLLSEKVINEIEEQILEEL